MSTINVARCYGLLKMGHAVSVYFSARNKLSGSRFLCLEPLSIKNILKDVNSLRT